MKCSLLTLSCYVDDELEERRRGEMEAHLVGCARCRAGLGHIREEVDRIGALARVRVVDHSAHGLLVQLGLIEPDDPLPERGDPVDDRSGTLPPWLQGQATASLPWTPERPARRVHAPRLPDGDPVELSGPPAAHRRLSALEGVPAAPFDLTVLTPDSRAPLVPRSTGGPPAVEVTSAGSTPAEAPEAEAILVEPPNDLHQPALIPPGPPADDIHEPAPIPLEPPADIHQPAAIPLAPPAEVSVPESPPAGDQSGSPSPGDIPTHAASPPAGDSAVAVWTSDPAEAPPGAGYPFTDEDVLGEPLPVERFTSHGPAPAPHPSLVDRLRDRLALRRAMGGDAKDEGIDLGVEIVSGSGAPLQPRGRGDLARRRAEALRPASTATVDDQPRARREPGVREMLPPPARPASHAGAPVRDPRPAGPDTLWDEYAAAAPPTGDVAGSAATAPPRRRREAAPSASRGGRRVAIAYAAGVAIIGAIGIVSARITTHAPIVSPAATATVPVAPPANTGAGSSSAVQPAPAASAAPGASAAPATPAAPSAVAAPAAAATIGFGGSGWAVQTIRVGDHGTYYRFVFDLGPAAAGATGEPKVALTYPDPKTLVLTITGATASATLPTIGTSSVIGGISVGAGSAPGTAVYRITLSKPATGKPLYLAGPLRLVVDISAG